MDKIRDLLQELGNWRYKIVYSEEKCGDELAAEFIDCFLANFEPLEDSTQRRELVYIAEKLVANCWQNANFRNLNGNMFVKLAEFVGKFEKIEFIEGLARFLI